MKKIMCMLIIGFITLSAGAQQTPAAVDQSAAEYADDTESGAFDDFEESGFGDEFAEHLTDVAAPYDPLEPYNRMMTSFNDTLFDYVLEPLFVGYDFVLSEPLRVSINNFFNNLYYPVSFVNNLLQFKFENAMSETGRFLINSTFGFAGLFDPAYEGYGIEPHVEDLGQTLGYYGVGSGFPIVLPFFGPTNLRDFSGDLLDFYVNPIYYVDAREYNIARNTYEGWALVGYKQFNRFSLYDKEYKQLRDEAIDFYPLMRDAYEQSRNKLIKE